jgi:predicted nucleic acid-binding protein
LKPVFVDTSAIYALLDSGDLNHKKAARAFDLLQEKDTELVTSSAVLLELISLTHRRLGKAVALRFVAEFEPLFQVIWVDSSLHETAIEWWKSNRLTKVSLVDAISFTVMNSQKLNCAFAYDSDFALAGFECLGS